MFDVSEINCQVLIDLSNSHLSYALFVIEFKINENSITLSGHRMDVIIIL